jgi:hypothetical protein
MTTIWLQPPDKTKPPVEVEYTKSKVVPLMVQGHRQVPPPEVPTSPAAQASPAPAPSPQAHIPAKPEPLPAMNEVPKP